MKAIQPSSNKEQWPRSATKTVGCRKRDLVVRITDWSHDKDEPGYDVECYIGGVFDWNESRTFTKGVFKTDEECKKQATLYAQAQILKLL